MAPTTDALFCFYMIQFVCSTVTATLNISTLCHELHKKERNVQFSMLIVHILVHILLAFGTSLHSGHMLYAIHDIVGRHECVFWFGNLMYSFSVVSGLADFLLGFDRYIAMKIPLKYSTRLGHKFAIFAFAVCLLLSGLNFIAMIFNRLPVTDDLVSFGQHVNLKVLYTHKIINTSFSIFNIIITVMFLWTYAQFNRKINANAFGLNNQSAIRKVNVIVINQIIVELLFIIIPDIVTSTAQLVFDVYWPATVGPYNSSLLALYIMCCAILYRVRLTQYKNASAEAESANKKQQKRVKFTLPALAAK